MQKLNHNHPLLRYLLPLLLATTLWLAPCDQPDNVIAAGGPNKPGEGLLPLTGFYVDTLVDDGGLSACTSAPDDCSLRGAINRANTSPGGDVINLPAGVYELHGDPGDDSNRSGDLDVLSSGGHLTINGEGPDHTIITTRGIDRVFHTPNFYSPFTLSLNNLTIQDGYAEGDTDGGGIRSYASLYLRNVRIADNSARNGAGLYFYATFYNTLIIENSTFVDNVAWKDGGGIYLIGERAEISRSSFANNNARQNGGAIYNNTPLSITASTFYNNRAKDGGALFNWAFLGDRITTEILNATFSNNSIAISNKVDGMGNTLTTAKIILKNTILAHSYWGENCVQKEEGSGKAIIENGGNNLDSGDSCGFSKAAGAGSLFGKDPLLGTFEDNGGPTNTMALLDGSPAIDNGNPATCPHRDQRGLASVNVCDIGAFEYSAYPLLAGSVPKSQTTRNGVTGSRLEVRVLNAFGNPLPGWTVFFDTPDYAYVTLSDPSAVTDENGGTAIVASSSDSQPRIVNAKAGTAGLQFSITRLGATPYLYQGAPVFLPITGFAPGVVTRLNAQPAEKLYHSNDGMFLQIPRLNVNIPIVGVPQSNGGWDLTWLDNAAGYLEGTAFPSWPGNSAITAHAYLSNGQPGPFANLGTLTWGDQVIISAWGQRYIYEVRALQVVSPAAIQAITHEDQPWLTLITCKDYNILTQSYSSRLLVRAVQVKIE